MPERQIPTGSHYEYPPRLYSGRYVYSLWSHDDPDDPPESILFVLLIDIDGPNTQDAVSGEVRANERREMFIGECTQGTPYGPPGGICIVDNDEGECTDPLGYRLVIENFEFNWPFTYTTDLITRLDIHLRHNRSTYIPEAEVYFANDSTGKRYGPYFLKRKSAYFRELEVEVDREAGSKDFEPYNTHAHPDRPQHLSEQDLTIVDAFAKAGILVTRPTEQETEIVTRPNNRWRLSELHDTMAERWSAYENVPQWKMWVLVAKTFEGRAAEEAARTKGLMFDYPLKEDWEDDADIDRPPERQGCAIFTHARAFEEQSAKNEPKAEALKRDIFFTLIHEIGHALNLAHSWKKEEEGLWPTPAWARPPTGSVGFDESKALSWMNYPWKAAPLYNSNTERYNATAFYRRFCFRFENSELFFLRHAPEEYVQPGNVAFTTNHGAAARRSIDHRLRLTAAPVKPVFELGENVFIELQLECCGEEPMGIDPILQPSATAVEIAITNPRGKRQPFMPIWKVCCEDERQLSPKERVTQAVDLGFGRLGFPFTEPGQYRIDVNYRNLDGKTAVATCRVFVSYPRDCNLMPITAELFDSRIGSVMSVGGTCNGDINDKIDWIRERLGKEHPAYLQLTATRLMPLAKPFKRVDMTKKKLELLEAQPDTIEKDLAPVVKDKKRRKALLDILKSDNLLHVVRELEKDFR